MPAAIPSTILPSPFRKLRFGHWFGAVRNRPRLAYALALVVPLATLLIRLAMGFKLGDAPMLIMFLVPTILSAYVGGLGPGLVATLCSGLLTDYYLLMPPGGLPLVSGLKYTLWKMLILVGFMISVLMEVLLRSERRYRAILDSALDAIMMIDHQGCIVEFSPAAERMFGHAASEVIGREMGEVIVPPALREQYSKDLARYLATGEVSVLGRRVELPVLRADGTEFPVEVSIQRIERSNPPLFTGFIRDISARKQTEQELVWRTALFEAQVDSSIDGILVVDAAGKKIIQNRRMAVVWKIPPEIADDPDDANQGRFVIGRVRNPEQFAAKVAHLYSHPSEIIRDVIELVDGTILDRYSAPVRDSHGKYYGRIWTFRDITEQRQLEEQLRQSQKMEAIGQLSGGIAHDFNNLLTAIIGHLGLLQGNPQVTPQIAESLGEISAAANRAANLTSQLLSFSRRQVISISLLDLNEVVTNLSKMLRRVLGEQVTVQLYFAPEELTFQGDAGMMEQVLVNLAVNARDAMPNGGTLRITTRRETRVPPSWERVTATAPGEFVRLSVGDTGTGILPEFRAKIFEPFFTTKGVGKGTGLGLATVFGIVQQHHGWIEVESEVGRGTTFHLYLPQQTRPPTTHLVGGSGEAALAARGRGELILLVEDEAAVQQVVMQALGRYGYRVLLASNGPEALKIWAERKAEIALLLTDLIMPEGITGLQLARQLLEEKPLLSVVYTSGYSAAIAGKELKMTDGVNYLAKPYGLDRLFRVVRAALDRKQSRSPF